jgi:E3 ubiquitin-protein ligase RFWD2
MRNSGIAANKMFNSPFPSYYLPQVFVYHKEFPMPVLAYKFSVTDPISGQEIDDQSQFISCVCWRGQSSTLLSANSSGNIKILEMD